MYRLLWSYIRLVKCALVLVNNRYPRKFECFLVMESRQNFNVNRSLVALFQKCSISEVITFQRYRISEVQDVLFTRILERVNGENGFVPHLGGCRISEVPLLEVYLHITVELG